MFKIQILIKHCYILKNIEEKYFSRYFYKNQQRNSRDDRKLANMGGEIMWNY
jgi:hypothetical protein